MVDNGSVASPAQVNIATKHTHNTTNTPSKNSFDKEKFGEIVDNEGDDDQYKGG